MNATFTESQENIVVHLCDNERELESKYHVLCVIQD